MVAAPNMQNTVFAGTSCNDDDFWLIKNHRFDEVIHRNESGILVRESNLDYSKMNVYKVLNVDYDKISNIVSENLNKEVDKDFLYETVFGHKCISISDIVFEDVVEELSEAEFFKYFKDAVRNTIIEGTGFDIRFAEYDREKLGLSEQIKYLDGRYSIRSEHGITFEGSNEYTTESPEYKFLKLVEG